MRKQERTSQKRRADEQGHQLDLFEPAYEDLEHVGDSQPHGQEPPERALAVDLEGANEYGLPTQIPLPAARGLPEEKAGAPEAVVVEGRPDSREEADRADQGPQPFLKLIARIAMRAGQKTGAKKEVTDASSSIPQGEQ